MFPLVTDESSPQLRGLAPLDATSIDVTVDGSVYTIPVVNGQWTLPQGTITPPLAGGVYDVALNALCQGQPVTDGTTNELTIEDDGWSWLNGNDHEFRLSDAIFFPGS